MIKRILASCLELHGKSDSHSDDVRNFEGDVRLMSGIDEGLPCLLFRRSSLSYADAYFHGIEKCFAIRDWPIPEKDIEGFPGICNSVELSALLADDHYRLNPLRTVHGSSHNLSAS